MYSKILNISTVLNQHKRITMKYNELSDSQLPASNLLQKFGYTLVNEDQIIKEKEGILSNVILEDILVNQLKEINTFEFKGEIFKA